MKKKIIITGGCGFIGTNFIEMLLKNNYQILNIDKLSYASNSKYQKNYNNYIFKKINLLNKNKLESIFKKFKPSCVFHFAAESHVDRSIDDPLFFVKNNILSTSNILYETYKFYLNLNLNDKKKFSFYYVGTDEIYGELKKNKKLRFDVKSKIDPNNPYSASKASGYLICKSFAKTYNFPLKLVNFCNNFGEYQYPEKFIPKTIISILSNKKVTVYGKGDQVRNWIYSKHASEKLMYIYEKKIKKPIINISSNFEASNIEIVKKIYSIMKKLNYTKNKLKIDFVTDRPGHDKRYSLKDNTKFLLSKTKYNIKFENQIANVIKWYSDKQNIKYFNKKNYLKRLGKLSSKT